MSTNEAPDSNPHQRKFDSGSQIDHYSIVGKLGAGGMGEVYRAVDTRLGRDVAIKVLPPHLASSADIRARFEREARTISQLNHPNICTLYDIGHFDGGDYLVFEYLQGETLAGRVERGPLAVNELLKVATQIVDALVQAHSAGIIHRDLKPGNVMIADSGVKLLDFGLARPTTTVDAPLSDETKTAVVPLTTVGAIVGTIQYMAPEQIDGKAVDARTDIFALGCVLFEMATGRRLFDGANTSAVLSSILKFDPNQITDLAEFVPKPLEQIIRRCVEKDPDLRHQSAADLAAELSQLRNWVRDEALPQLMRIIETIQTLDEGPEAWDAFLLACEIRKFEPDNPKLEQLWQDFTRKISITSDPPGALVSARYYGKSSTHWVRLGTTPLVDLRFPRGITQLRVELADYRCSEDVLWIYELGTAGATDSAIPMWHYLLSKPGEIPDEMERVPAGKFNLFMPGLDHLTSEPTVAFLMDRHPVTNRMYKEFVDAGGYRNRDFWRHPFNDGDRTLSWEEAMARFVDTIGQPGPAKWEMGEYPHGEDNYPVTGVSWFEANAYAAWAGKELPTIFHWNRVAFTVASSHMIPLANFSDKGPVPVGTTASINRFGVHDLAGNVPEWALNECNRRGDRFILGGGWNDAEYAFTDAFAISAFNRNATNGFRCIRPLETETNRHNLERQIELPFRDFRVEKPVPDEVFNFFLRQFHYDPTPLNAEIVAEEPTNVGIRQTIHFAAAYGGEQMIAYLYLPPKLTNPLQTVVLFPGSLAIHSTTVGPSELRRSEFIVKSGRALLLPIYKGTYQRGDELNSDYPEPTAFYRDHVIMWGKDLARSIDYLETRNDIDLCKLAYYGISWGGAMGAIMPAIEKRINLVILYVAGMVFQRSLPEADQINYVSRVTQPTLMLNGELDFFFPAETSQKPMFDLLGTPPEYKKYISYPLGHSVPRNEHIKEVLAWLDRYFGPVQ
ncbi:MAG: protein kinase [bacterium]|nr:protein kinase [bacterium]